MTDGTGASAVPCNLAEVESLARERLPRELYEFFAGGAGDEVTVRENVAAFSRLALRPRVLVDVRARDPSTTVLGTRVAFPVLIAPTAYQRMAHPDGEVATARGTALAGSLMVMSSAATSTIEEVSQAGAPLWFQLYVYRDREATRAIVGEAETRGCRALVLTVDTPMVGRRERDVRNGFAIPESIRRFPGPLAPRATEGGSFATHFTHPRDEALTWRDLDWLRSITSLPLVLKGVLRGDDAARAIEHGVQGIIVSNHGGRQLDTVVASADALPEVVAAVEGRAEVYVDGGVRRGTDVLKAIALGARAVLIGRPVIWGLAVGGADGVRRVLQMLRDEVDLGMALAGCRCVGDITSDLVTGPCGSSAPRPT